MGYERFQYESAVLVDISRFFFCLIQIFFRHSFSFCIISYWQVCSCSIDRINSSSSSSSSSSSCCSFCSSSSRSSGGSSSSCRSNSGRRMTSIISCRADVLIQRDLIHFLYKSRSFSHDHGVVALVLVVMGGGLDFNKSKFNGKFKAVCRFSSCCPWSIIVIAVCRFSSCCLWSIIVKAVCRFRFMLPMEHHSHSCL